MNSNIIFLIVGLAIGWNMPQPQWAKDVQAKVEAYVQTLSK